MSVTTFIAPSLMTDFLFIPFVYSFHCFVRNKFFPHRRHLRLQLQRQSDPLDVHSYISAKVMEEDEDSSSGSSEL